MANWLGRPGPPVAIRVMDKEFLLKEKISHSLFSFFKFTFYTNCQHFMQTVDKQTHVIPLVNAPFLCVSGGLSLFTLCQ